MTRPFAISSAFLAWRGPEYELLASMIGSHEEGLVLAPGQELSRQQTFAPMPSSSEVPEEPKPMALCLTVHGTAGGHAIDIDANLQVDDRALEYVRGSTQKPR